jgi:hypothetical protein
VHEAHNKQRQINPIFLTFKLSTDRPKHESPLSLTIGAYSDSIGQEELLMEAELTLRLDQSLIFGAKKYAEANQRTLSALVENYFKQMPLEQTSAERYPPLIEDLSGIISEQELEKLAMEDTRVRHILGKDR